MQSYPGSFRLAAVIACIQKKARPVLASQLALTPVLQLFDEFSLALPTRGTAHC